MYAKSSNHRFSSFLIPIMVIVLAYFTGTKVITDASVVFSLIFAAILALLFIKKPAWALALLIVMGTNFFGAVKFTNLPSIPLPGLGGFYIHDIFLLLSIGIMFLQFSTGKSESFRSSISYPIIALIILTIIEGIRSFFWGSSPAFLAERMRPIAFYLIFFLILGTFRTKNKLETFIKLLVFIAIITAGVTYIQTLTGGLNLASKVEFRTDYQIYQSLNKGMYVVTCVFMFLFSMIIGKKGDTKSGLLSSKIILLWIGGSILLVLSRSLWASTLIGMGIIILLTGLRIRKTITILILLLTFFTMTALLTELITGSKSFSFIISDRLSTAYHDIWGMSGRTEMMIVRWDYMIHNSPLLGVGFREPANVARDSFTTKMSFKLDPTIFCAHNIVADLSVRYGLSGFLVMGWLLFAVFKKGARLLKTLPVSWEKSCVCGLLGFNIHAVVSSYFGGSLYLLTWGIIILSPSWAMLELIDRFHKRKFKLRLKE